MLKGNLILLRAIEESDLETIQAWNFDEDTTRFFSPRLPNNMLEQRKWFESQINRADKKKLMIVDASTETPIGLLGLMNIDHVNKNCEIGITIDNNYRGKPHSLDAMQTALHFLFYEFSMQLVYLTVFAENKRAISFLRNWDSVTVVLSGRWYIRQGNTMTYFGCQLPEKNFASN